MPVTSIDTDPENLSITIVADFPVPLQRLWDAYLDPRQIERFWGPPGYPSTFLRHDGAAGGRSIYKMTGPEGEEFFGCWDWESVESPNTFVVLDNFADETGAPNTDMPSTHMDFAFTETDTGSRLTTVATFASIEQMQQQIDMGVLDGTKQAMAQIDGVLADLRAFSADLAVESQLLSDTQVRVARVIQGTAAQVWRAHNEAELLQRWLLGPDGWTMPVCIVAEKVGDTYRYEWQPEGGGDGFGFTGELLESEEPYRAVTTESMIGMPGSTLNELTLTPVEGGTLLTLVITYANAEMRDMVLATGMTGGMETSYARLEGLLAG